MDEIECVVVGAGVVVAGVVVDTAVVAGAVLVDAVVVAGAGAVVGTGIVVATGPNSCIAGAGSSSSAPLSSVGMSIQRISPTSQRWTNGK